MKFLRNHLVGVDQGSVNLFSDFDTGGEMWTGSGARQRSVQVVFSGEFRAPPMVHVSLDMWDIERKSNQRVDVSAEDVSPKGFAIVFRTWGDTKVARVRAAWMAIGEVAHADDWDVE